MAITLQVTAGTSLEITSGTTLELTPSSTEILINTAAVASQTPAELVSFPGYGNLSAGTIQEAIQQLADNQFRQSSAPTTNLDEGDTWYNTVTEQFNVYRETSSGVFQWVPILLGSASGDSDTLDAGAF
jgi:hypothetical protein